MYVPTCATGCGTVFPKAHLTRRIVVFVVIIVIVRRLRLVVLFLFIRRRRIVLLVAKDDGRETIIAHHFQQSLILGFQNHFADFRFDGFGIVVQPPVIAALVLIFFLER